MQLIEFNFNAFIGLIISCGILTFLFPTIAAIFSIFQKHTGKTFNPSSNLTILIPAYSEENTIHLTLQSIQKNINQLSRLNSNIKVSIIIGLDGSKDSTPQVAKQFASSNQNIMVIDRTINFGKWKTLLELFQASTSDWVAFVDCGTIWPDEFLTKIVNNFDNTNIVGIAPGYRPLKVKFIENLVWTLELVMKKIENFSGGPVSLHGATMFFRSKELQSAFSFLEKNVPGESWLNDDVVLSLAMRCQGNIKYLGGNIDVHDCGVATQGNELIRRERMLRGNLQWIVKLWPSLIRRNFSVALLALRRIFRVLWVYNIAVIILFFCKTVGFKPPIITVVFSLFGLLLMKNSRIRAATLASLKTPLLFINRDNKTSNSKPWA